MVSQLVVIFETLRHNKLENTGKYQEEKTNEGLNLLKNIVKVFIYSIVIWRRFTYAQKKLTVEERN